MKEAESGVLDFLPASPVANILTLHLEDLLTLQRGNLGKGRQATEERMVHG